MPVFVDAEDPEKADGWATLFPSPKSTSFRALQAVTKEEFFNRLDRWKTSKPDIWLLCGGVLQMRLAYQTRDEAAFRLALKNVWKWVPHFGSGEGLKSLKDERAWAGTNWIYSSLMANLLQSSRFILLSTGKDTQPLMPGLYCPDWETAAFAFIGAGQIRMCPYPKCHKIFMPDEHNKYCEPAHGVADRTRLSRWRRKQREAEKQSKKARKSLR